MNRIGAISNRIANEPFRIFFPLGVIAALISALYWPGVTYQLGFTAYPSQFHILMMIFGFIWAFIVGFLTTAVPNLTQTKTLSRYELSLLIFLYMSTIIGLFIQCYLMARIGFLLTLVSLVIILGQRFVARKRNFPPTFIYIPFGLLSALIATVISIGQETGILPYADGLTRLGRNLLFQGMILFLLIGIGGFLIRSILGWAPALPISKSDKMPQFKKIPIAKNIHLVAALFLFASFILEAVEPTYAQAIRAVIVTLVLMLQVKIYRIPISGKLTSTTLLIALWLLVIGLWGQVFASPQYTVAFRHFCFMGGFAISIFAVATRVIFSHCGYSSLLSKRFWPFSVSISFVGLGLAIRFSATFFPDIFFTHLAYSSVIWCMGVLVWSYAVLMKSFKTSFGTP